MKTLVLIPTYNERENAPRLCDELLALGLPIDLLFVDDNSPDGTGETLDEKAAQYPNVKVLHRTGKLGIGSAHYAGIQWAYEQGYQVLVTMDADFTHRPQDIPRMLALASGSDVVVASRYMAARSLPGWNMLRKCLTHTGHILTRTFLGMSQDATGALRLYRLDRVPFQVFELVSSKGYSFFFESLYILHCNGFKIHEIPIELPARTYGSSKMDLREVKRSVALLVKTFCTSQFNRDRYTIAQRLTEAEIDRRHDDTQGWDKYWAAQQTGWSFVYDTVAAIYRKLFIRPSLNRFIKKAFKPGAKLLHAGSGGGQVDRDIRSYADITPLDISVNALNRYRQVHGKCELIHGSIFNIPAPDGSYDGVYNLGVMEHFTEADILQILGEFHRVLKPGGKIVLFWPPEFGFSVTFFKALGLFTRTALRKSDAKFHPDEITRLQSKAQAERLLREAAFELSHYYFGPRDLFTQSMIIADRREVSGAESAAVARSASGGVPPAAA